MTQCDYESIESVENDLYKNLHELVTTPFFRHFRVRVSVFLATTSELTHDRSTYTGSVLSGKRTGFA